MRRFAAILVLLAAVMLPGMAQESALILTRETPASATLEGGQLARVFFFVAVANETLTLRAEGDDPLRVGFMVTAADGTTLAQAEQSAGGRPAVMSVVLPTTATYFVTVMPVGEARTGRFTLTLSEGAPAAEADVESTPEATPETTTTAAEPPVLDAAAEATPETTADTTSGEFIEPQQVLLPNGITVSLAWAANADLNLEVRDPVGNSLFFDSRTSPIGGAFGFDANGFCQVITPAPVEQATWAPGFLPTGNYEILVFYRQACAAPAPVEFTVTVNVNGTTLPAVTGTLNPPLPGQNSTYLTSFRINPDTTAQANAGGVYPDSSLNVVAAPPSVLVSTAVPIARDEVVVGSVTQGSFYRVYRYEAAANELINARVTALNGSLDTLLQITDANGNLVGVNDDSNNTTNSEVVGLRLGNAGIYYFIVTRYGKDVGGTEGQFEFTITEGELQVPMEVLGLDVPAGEVQVFLTWQSPADVQLLVRDPAGEAVFDDRLAVTSGGQMTLQGNLNCTAAQGSPASYIFWPTGFLRAGNYEIDVWYQNQCTAAPIVDATLTVLVRGRVVVVESLRLSLDQHFVMGFNVLPDGTAQARPGGLSSRDAAQLPWQTRTPLPITLNVPVQGQINDGNVFNVYSFEGTAGQSVVIASASTSPTLDTKLFLMGPNGQQLAENDDGGVVSPTLRRTDAIIANVTLLETGRHTIITTRYAMNFGNTVGSYALTITSN